MNQYVKPNSGTVSRRLILKNKWHFECDCRRCKDPTEFGSLLSALTCEKVILKYVVNSFDYAIFTNVELCIYYQFVPTFQCSDAVLPEQPTEVEADWNCSYYGSDYSVEYVSKALLNAEKALKDSNDNEDIIQHYER